MNEDKEYKIREWKKLYGSIFKVKISDEEYIYRELNVGECEQVSKFLATNDQIDAENIALGAVLCPESLDLDSLGITTAKILAECILGASKVFRAEGIIELIDKAKENVKERIDNDFFQWKLILIKTFPGYSLSDLDKLSIQEFFNLLMLAEKLTNQKIVNYAKLKSSKKQETNPESLKEIKTDSIVPPGGKFMSKAELEQIAAEDATKTLREHYLNNKNKKK